VGHDGILLTFRLADGVSESFLRITGPDGNAMPTEAGFGNGQFGQALVLAPAFVLTDDSSIRGSVDLSFTAGSDDLESPVSLQLGSTDLGEITVERLSTLTNEGLDDLVDDVNDALAAHLAGLSQPADRVTAGRDGDHLVLTVDDTARQELGLLDGQASTEIGGLQVLKALDVIPQAVRDADWSLCSAAVFLLKVRSDAPAEVVVAADTNTSLADLEAGINLALAGAGLATVAAVIDPSSGALRFESTGELQVTLRRPTVSSTARPSENWALSTARMKTNVRSTWASRPFPETAAQAVPAIISTSSTRRTRRRSTGISSRTPNSLSTWPARRSR